MKKLLAVFVLLLSAVCLKAQTVETITSGPGNQGCSVTPNNPCFASIFNDGVSAGFADIYLVRQADGSFQNGTILRYSNDMFQWSTNNLTGTGTVYTLLPGSVPTDTRWSTDYDGDYSTTLADGSTVSGHVHLTIIKRRYVTGGFRRITITGYWIDSGTFTENVTPAPNQPVPDRV